MAKIIKIKPDNKLRKNLEDSVNGKSVKNLKLKKNYKLKDSLNHIERESLEKYNVFGEDVVAFDMKNNGNVVDMSRNALAIVQRGTSTIFKKTHEKNVNKVIELAECIYEPTKTEVEETRDNKGKLKVLTNLF